MPTTLIRQEQQELVGRILEIDASARRLFDELIALREQLGRLIQELDVPLED